MKGNDYVPSKENEFHDWLDNLYPIITSSVNWRRWKLLPEVITPELQIEFDNYMAKYDVSEHPETRTPAAVTARQEARSAIETSIRKFLKANIIYNPDVTDEDRRNMRLPLHDNKPSPVPPPTDVPNIEVDFSKRQEHIIIGTNKDGKKSKPKNVTGFQVYRKFDGEAPKIEADFSLVGTSTRHSYTINYPLEDVGKTVWYRIRYVNGKNEPGPWSETVSAVIA